MKQGTGKGKKGLRVRGWLERFEFVAPAVNIRGDFDSGCDLAVFGGLAHAVDEASGKFAVGFEKRRPCAMRPR